MKIPFFSFAIMNAEIKPGIFEAFGNFFDSGWYVLGEKVSQFEREYADFTGVAHAAGVSNGLDALHIALKVLGIGPGDEVIVPSNTYIATLLAVSYVGARPVLVEPDVNTYNINPAIIEEVINSRTKVILPVHLYGQACEMAEVQKIAGSAGLWIVEDNAQAQGATYNGKMTGSFGSINATSFYPSKNLGAFGDAGAITTDDSALADKVKVLRNYGSQRKYYNEVVGYNMRLDECQAAFLSIKLKFLRKWNADRNVIADQYNELLRGVGDIKLPMVAKGATHVYHQYVIRTYLRDELQVYLAEKGIGTFIHYPVPPHMQEAYRHLGFKKGDFPLAEEIANTCLSLPIWPGLTKEEVERISKSIRIFFSGR